MSTQADARLARRVLRHELEAIRGNWGWFLALGIILIIVGTIAVGMPFVASLATAFTFGALLLVGGSAQLLGAFWTRDWSGFFLSLLMGVLYVVLGLLFLRDPGDVLVAMTLLLACVLMVGGLFRIIGSLMFQFPHWGWTLSRRCNQPGTGHPDLAAMAGLRPLGDWPVRRDRPDLHWLDVGDAVLGGEKPRAADHDNSSRRGGSRPCLIGIENVSIIQHRTNSLLRIPNQSG